MKREAFVITVKISVLALVLAAAWPDALFAQNMQKSTREIVKALEDTPTIISGLAYLGGAIMVMGGANKLKMHAENPTQTPMSHGLVRIGVGAVIAGMPPFMKWVNESLSVGDQDFQFTKLKKISELMLSGSGWC